MFSDICDTTFEMFIAMSQGHDQPYLGYMYVGTSFQVYKSALRTWLRMYRKMGDTTFQSL